VSQANQIKKFSKVFAAATVHKHYVPLYLQLCQDQVAEVRLEAARATRNLLLTLSGSPALLDDFLANLRLFRASAKYNLR
jgi:hypothetical protein